MNENQPNPKLKLYVVGESSPDPNEWSEWNETRSLVIAANQPDALRLADRPNWWPVVEVAMSEPALLVMNAR